MAYNPVQSFNVNQQQQPLESGWLSSLLSIFGGNPQQPDMIHQIQRFNPQQQQALTQLLSMGLGGLSGLPGQYQQQRGQQNSFAPIAQEARSQFASQTIPSIAERFTSLGGGQRSSAFQGALGQAGAGLERSLASLGSEFGQRQQGLNLQNLGQQQNLFGSLLGAGLSPQYDSHLRFGAQPTQGFGGQALQTLAGLAPYAAMFL